MQIINQIGHIQHWGLTPAINLLQNWNQAEEKQQKIRILISGCSDIRHILKTLTDISAQNKTFQKIQFYVHQTKKELLCRCLLFLHIIHQTNLNYQERTELYLDLFGNAMIKQRNARYLHHLRQDLLNFIHDQNKVLTPIKQFVNLKLLKFQERDEMSEFIQSWSMKTQFDMQKFRDQKLRYLYKERYDYRANLVDWDYNMCLIPWAPIVHFYHYRQWRMTGLAFQQRFSTYSEPNRTLSSYAPGKRKQSRTTCLVRGYWGDITISPYISIGVQCDYPQRQLLFKKANQKYIGNSVQLSIYNMMYWLHRIQQNKEYKKVFRDYYRSDEQTKKMMQQKNQEKKRKKNALKQIKEDQNQQQQIEEKQKEQQTNQDNPQQNKQKRKEEQLDSDQQRQKQEVQKKNSKEIQINNNQNQVLFGFKKYNVQIFQMAMQPENLIKPKFEEFFDIVILGFQHSAYITKQRNIQSVIKKSGQLILQKATYLVPKKKEQREELNNKFIELMKETPKFQKIKQNQNYLLYKKNDQ